MALSATSLLILILLLVLILGAAPSWPHSRKWGYVPSGALSLILVVVLVLAILRYI